MHVAILTRQIGHYHDARYRAAAAVLPRVTVVATANEGGFAEFLARDLGGYAVERLFPDRAAYDAAVHDDRLGGTLKATLDRIAPDALAVSGWANAESVLAISWSRHRGIPTVLMSESQADDAPRSFLRETFKRRIVSQFDSALVGGPSHADYAAALGIPRERIHYGYNAVDNAHFAAGAKAARAKEADLRTGLGLPQRYILASARFIAKKNLPNLVHAYAVARKAVAGAPDLVILGDGPERDAVERAVAENRQERRVHLPGFRGYDKLPAFYGLSEGFVHVSTSEQWGLVVNEAMASSVSVIASRPCGAARSVIQDGVTGFLTGVEVASISEALIRLFNMTPKQRSDMGVAGANAIRDWGPERFGSGMRAAVESARKAPSRGRILPWDRAILAQLQKRSIATVS